MAEPVWTEFGAAGGVLAFSWLIVKEVLGMLRRADTPAIDWEERDFHIRAIVREELQKAQEHVVEPEGHSHHTNAS